ncbi:hypothetical protein [Streptomyces sp. NPDC001770]
MTASAAQGSRALPTSRITPRRTQEILDVIRRLGGEERSPVSTADISSALKLAPKSAMEAATFLIHIGLLEPDRKAWSLTPLGLNLTRLRAEDPTRARLLLRDAWQPLWFNRRACRLLANGTRTERDLAGRLQAGLPGRPERGLFLVEWMVYALLVEHDGDGHLSLPAPSHSTTTCPSAPGVADPLALASVEQLTALPDAEFISVMNGYRTILLALSHRPSAPSGN